MANLIKDILTTVDNQSFEAGRVLWVATTLSLIVFQGVAIWINKQPFNPIEFGGGVAAILGLGGFGIAQKDRARTAAKEAQA